MQKFSNIFIKVAVVVAFAVGFFTLGYHVAPAVKTPIPQALNTASTTVSIMIDTGATVKTITDIPYRDGETVAQLLETLASTSAIQLSSKDYGGELGVFIESINGVGLGDKNKWWQFWVNNKYSTVGASAYVLKSGDIVAFKFIGSQQ